MKLVNDLLSMPIGVAKKYSDGQILAVLLLVAFVIRCLFGFIVFSSLGESSFMDTWDYVYLAQNMLEQGPFPLEVHKWSREIGPGYSWVIAGSFYLFGKTYWPLVFFNVLCSTAITAVVYLLAKEVYRREVAVVAGAWSVFYVQFFKYTPWILKESLVIFLFALVVFQTICIVQGKRRKGDLAWLVVSFAFLIHVDERYFFYLPLFGVFLLLAEGAWKQRLVLAGVFCFAISLSVIPWTYRNYLFYDRLVILTERTTKFTDPFFGYPPLKSYADLMSYDKANHPLYEAIADSIRAGYKVHIKNVKFIPDIERAIREGRDVRTFTPAEHYWEEFKELWRPAKFGTSMAAYGYRYQAPWSMSSNIVFLISYGLLLPFLLLEVVHAVKQPSNALMFMVVILVLHTVMHVFMAHARERYRIPLDPIIIAMSLGCAYRLFETYLGKHQLDSKYT